ncbi:TPA: hypothetical protein N0F65_012030 [Lagenidium giganteum]|uniref:Uncharacterized protein n=1 Tax=Lagenidium giganteum TaxID=4803 RepID=A0AAV2YUM9_9STRA|nr:TPA: hypothetical protein N0F65_012030 [Lagenidium giganteum]
MCFRIRDQVLSDDALCQCHRCDRWRRALCCAWTQPGRWSAETLARDGREAGTGSPRRPSFRQALDSLRGDRPAQRASANHPPPSAAVAPSVSSSPALASNDKIQQFLLNASSDSQLSDYVERKLRQSSQRRTRHRPTAMEPPPSLSASSRSSLHSTAQDLEDSILNKAGDLTMSLAERNLAEVEKLRLSQRLREVNNVLNGFLPFQHSFLSRSQEQPSPTRTAAHKSDADAAASTDVDEDDDDELPVMIAKKVTVKAKPVSDVEMQPIRQEQPPILRERRATEEPLEPPSAVREALEESVASISLEDSLPAFSEPVRKLQQLKASLEASKPMSPTRKAEPRLMSRDGHGAVSNRTSAAVASGAPKRSALHQQLIDKTIRHKRNDILSHAFVRWRRGLRVQTQRRSTKAHQSTQLHTRLSLLRRNQIFYRWKTHADMKTQVRSSRLDAFELRMRTRALAMAWNAWRREHWRWRCQSHALRAITGTMNAKQLARAFDRWQRQCRAEMHLRALASQREHGSQRMQRRMDAVAARHYDHHVLRQQQQRVLRAWHQLVAVRRRQRVALRRMMLRWINRKALRAWRRWREHVACAAHGEVLRRNHVQELTTVRQQQAQVHAAYVDNLKQQHDQQLREVELTAKQQHSQLQQRIENERKLREQQRAEHLQQVTQGYQQTLEQYLEQAVTKVGFQLLALSTQMDQQIANISAVVEQLLQDADTNLAAARFRAASLLVESTLEQKMTHASARVQLQEELVLLLAAAASTAKSRDWTETRKPREWSDNARFLHDMLDQRLQRLLQLHLAVAKVAAAVSEVKVDPRKLENGQYLAETMFTRERVHVDEMVRLLQQRSHVQPSGPTAPRGA